jgi:hypothetical protein
MAVFWLLAAWFFVRTGRTLRHDLDAAAETT